MNLPSVEVSTLKERVYKSLLHAIVSGKLAPGTQITIGKLSAQFGVSLMPVREALRKLEAGKFISIQRNRRIAIQELSKDDLNEFSKKVLNAHKRIYKPLMERNGENAREEMIKHVREVEKDLLALQKERRIEELNLQRLSRSERSLISYEL